MDWKIGNLMDNTLTSVCKQAFCNVHGVSSSHVDNIVKDIKKGIRTTEPAYSDKSTVELAMFPQLHKLAKGFGLYLTKKQVAAAKLPNSPTVLTAYGWMAAHFDLIGDMAPNKDGEIHLEPCHIVEVYGEYILDMQHADTAQVHVDTFASIWKSCFEYVKIREFKAVSGKCACCANLSTMRKTFKNRHEREYIKMMHALHRSTYMGERISYATRRNQAVMEKSRYLSTISDGMQQGHNMLPHMANQNTWQDGLPQHLQGILNHNRGLKMYRTFHNINNCANVAMYTWLDTLEKVHVEEGKLPDTIYHQIDGGSENTAKAWFALCELIVARRLCKRIVLSRLMVGHTHEDIDSKFGILWKKIRHKYVYTPQQYDTCISKYLSTKRKSCTVVDVFAVPDFKKLLDDYVDPALRAQSKCEKTQLQWSFEACTPDEFFKNGVKIFYRAYSTDEVCQIIEDKNAKMCGVVAKVCDVFDFPVKNAFAGILVDGMTILQSLPMRKPDPYPFLQGSREVLDKVLVKVQQEFGTCHPKLVADWQKWAAEEAPASDSVDEYLLRKPLHIPLGDILFSDKAVDDTIIDPTWDTNLTSQKLQRLRTTDCVAWNRWGFKREDHSVENLARLQQEVAADGKTVVEVNGLPEKVAVFRGWSRKQKKKPDETGEFKFVLGRVGGKTNINAALTEQGQLISLTNGGCRIYWKHKKKPLEYKAEDVDTSFEAEMALGWYCYGKIIPPANGNGVKGDIQLQDADGCRLATQVWPPRLQLQVPPSSAAAGTAVTAVVQEQQQLQVPPSSAAATAVAPVKRKRKRKDAVQVQQQVPPPSAVTAVAVTAVVQEQQLLQVPPSSAATAVAPVKRKRKRNDAVQVQQQVPPPSAVTAVVQEPQQLQVPPPSADVKQKRNNKWDGYVESICGVLSDNIITTKRQRKSTNKT
jgi:hypothetical protein